jgi:hypothetical protein
VSGEIAKPGSVTSEFRPGASSLDLVAMCAPEFVERISLCRQIAKSNNADDSDLYAP